MPGIVTVWEALLARALHGSNDTHRSDAKSGIEENFISKNPFLLQSAGWCKTDGNYPL